MLGKFISQDSDCHGKFRSPQNSQFHRFKDGRMRLPHSFCHTEKKDACKPLYPAWFGNGYEGVV